MTFSITQKNGDDYSPKQQVVRFYRHVLFCFFWCFNFLFGTCEGKHPVLGLQNTHFKTGGALMKVFQVGRFVTTQMSLS